MLAVASMLAACAQVPSGGTSGTGRQSSTTAPAGTASTNSSTTTTTTLPPSFHVGIVTVVFTDESRPTLSYAPDQAPVVIAHKRVISTEIRYPTLATGSGPELRRAPPASGYGPFPVVLFAHGYAVMPDTYQQLLDAWVQAGYVVVAPIFPVSNYYSWKAQGEGGAPEADIGNQPQDVAFVLEQLRAGRGGPLGKLMDLHRVALAGQSDGATTVGGLEFFTFYRGTLEKMGITPKAVALLSAGVFTSGGTYNDPPSPPALLEVHSDSDTCSPTWQASTLYNAVAPGTPAHYFLTLHGAEHIAPFMNTEPWASIVRSVTTTFFELELGSPLGHAPTPASLVAAGQSPKASSMVDATSISLPPTEQNDAGCGIPQPGPAP